MDNRFKVDCQYQKMYFIKLNGMGLDQMVWIITKLGHTKKRIMKGSFTQAS